jgi:NADH:ubiquinone oxidoreductase 49 kD subunit 7
VPRSKNGSDAREVTAHYPVTEIVSAGMTLNMGPQHPSTHGVLRLIVEVDGEVIKSCWPVIGYLPRGLEKMMEVRPYRHNVPFTDRLDYLAALCNNLAISQAIERIGGLEVPERAQYIGCSSAS